MSIRKKMLLIVSGVLLLFCGGLFLLSQTVMLDGYLDLEHRTMQRDLGRIQKNMDAYFGILHTTAFDWSAWDDAYEFVQTKNQSFVQDNLVDNTFNESGFRLNFIVFLDSQQNVVYQKGYDWVKDQEAPFPKGILGHLTQTGLPVDKPRVGFLGLPEGLFVVSSRPILTSEERGPPAGQLIMGRLFGREELKRVAEQIELDLTMYDMGSGTVPSFFKEAHAQISAGAPLWVSAESSERLRGVVALADIYGKPVLLINVSKGREIYTRGVDSAHTILGAVALTGVLLAFIIFFALEHLVLAPLKQVRADIQKVEGLGDLSVRVGSQSAAELDDLVRVMNVMLDKLDMAEQEMVRLERLSALGEMAAGINHNLNNILVGVTMSSQVLLETVHDEKCVEYVRTINQAGKQAADLVARLQDAVLGDSDEGSLQTLNTIIRDSVETARTRWKDEADLKGIEIKILLDLEEDLPQIRGSSSGLYNIMLNLIFNAVDAMPEGGELEIKSARVGEGVQVSVRDTGVGMDEETQKRVFEPFFTTKVEIGTGLGLATVYNTVVRWGGRVQVGSVLGAGSVFTLWFPRDGQIVPEPEVTSPVLSAQGQVLVVDDHDVVTQLVEHVLSASHEVACLQDGKDVLPALDSNLFDVVVLDLGMPGVPGDKIAEVIRERFPTVVLVLMTGWRLEDDDPRLALFDFVLKKPLHDMERVRNVVAQAVNLCHERQRELGVT